MGKKGLALVTGASGFVGAHVCSALVREGWKVRGLYRSSPQSLLEEGMEVAFAPDLTDRAAIRSALWGVDAVVHLAARVHVMQDAATDPLAEYRRVNVEGTRVVLEESVRAGVSTFIFISSVKAVGESSGDGPWTEDTVAKPVDPYGISKLEAEALVRDIASNNELSAPILRLPLVYGPGVGANMAALFRFVDRGVPLPFGRIRNRRSLAYVGNVAAAVRAVIGSLSTGSEIFFVSDGRDLSTPELIREVARALGRPARLLPVPLVLFRAAGRIADLAGGVAPASSRSAAVERLTSSLAVDSSKLRRITGFEPPFTLSEGMDATAVWYREQLSEVAPD